MDFSFLFSFLEKLMYGQKVKHVREAFLRVYERYHGEDLLPLKGRLEHLSYALYRMPATFSALQRVFGHCKEVLPTFSPLSLLDLGTGPGTAIIAALQNFPLLQESIGLENSREFIHLCSKLFDSPNISIRSHDLQSVVMPTQIIDLVTASYSFGELDENTRKKWLEWALSHSKVIALVEPGTPQGWRCLMECRDMLIAQGAHIVAPCPHEKPCPFIGTKWWCHESIRLPRTKFHKWIKSGELGYEDEKFCYLIAVCDNDIEKHMMPCRIVHAPKHRSGHTHLSLCTSKGQIENRVISRKNKEVYARVKKSKWGDSFCDHKERV